MVESSQDGWDGYPTLLTGITMTSTEVNTMMTSNGYEMGLHGWCQGLSASLDIPSSTLLAENPGSVSNGATYWTHREVLPGDTTVPTSLTCVRDCPTASSLAAILTNDTPYTAATGSAWSIAKADAVTYTWSAADYELSDDTGSVVDASALPDVSGEDWDNRCIYTGHLVPTADVADLECDYDSDMYCESAFLATNAVYYELKTGANQWCGRATFLKDSDDQYVDFSPPTPVTFTVPDDSDTYGDLAGGSLRLEYEGHGNLRGFMHQCVDKSTNEITDCSGDTSWEKYPTIPDSEDGFVMLNGQKKWVKALNKQLRFKSEPSVTSTARGITMGDADNMPPAAIVSGEDPNDPSNPDNVNVYAGAFSPSIIDFMPSFIDGVAQCDNPPCDAVR